MEKRRFSILEEDGVEFGIQREHVYGLFDSQLLYTIPSDETLEVLEDNFLIVKRRLILKGALKVKGTLGII